MAKLLYLIRHGEQQDAEFGVEDGPLSARGVRQAELVAERLRDLNFTHAWHSPLQRAEETADRIMTTLGRPASEPSSLLMDCIPSGPVPGMPRAFESFFGGIQPEQWEAGAAQMADAMAEWFTPSREDRHEVLVTHNFVIAWFVREVLEAPEWRWLAINQVNAGLTVLRVRTVKPHAVITHNEYGHLPPELQTGYAGAPLF